MPNPDGWRDRRKPRRLWLPQVTDSRGRITQATGDADDSNQKGLGQTVEPIEQVSTDVTVSDTGTKSRTAYKGTLRTNKDQSSSSESDFGDQDRKPEDKVTNEDDSDAMPDSERSCSA